MALISSSEPRTTRKSPNHAINWIQGHSDVEVLNSVSGKEIGLGISRLAKTRLFERYKQVIEKLPDIDNRSVLSTYQDTKTSSFKYQQAKAKFFDVFKKLDLGTWIKKPCEQDLFTI